MTHTRQETICVDIDGVLCDLVAGAIPIINARFDCHLKHQDIVMFEMDRIVGVPQNEFNEIFKEIDYLNLSPMPDASASLEVLRQSNLIRIVTSRPPELRSVTEEWLKKNGMQYDEIICSDDRDDRTKQSQWAGASTMIDDDLRVAIAAGAKGLRSILIDSPWNSSLNSKALFVRLTSWDDVADLLATKQERTPSGLTE